MNVCTAVRPDDPELVLRHLREAHTPTVRRSPAWVLGGEVVES